MSAETDNLLHFVPIVMRSETVNDWERQFLISIAGRMKRGAFQPSQKQLPILRRIVERFKDATLRDELIEGDDARRE